MNKERITVFGLGQIGERIIRRLSGQHTPNITLVNVDRKPQNIDIPGVQYICSDNITEQPLRDLIHYSDMVIVLADLGSKLTTEVVPIIGFLSGFQTNSKQNNKFCLAFLVFPSIGESSARIKRGEHNLGLVRESVDSIVVLNHDKITELGIRKASTKCDSERVEHEIAHYIRMIAESMLGGAISIDVDLLKETLKRDAYIGFGSSNRATGEGFVHDAVSQAFSNILLKTGIQTAKNALVYVKFDCGCSFEDADQAFELAESMLKTDAEILIGMGIDTEAKNGDLSVLILGSGFDNWDDLEEDVLYF